MSKNEWNSYRNNKDAPVFFARKMYDDNACDYYKNFLKVDIIKGYCQTPN